MDYKLKVKYEPLVSIAVNKVELTQKRINAPLLKGKIKPVYRRSSTMVCGIYLSWNTLDATLKELREQNQAIADTTKVVMVQECACCKKGRTIRYNKPGAVAYARYYSVSPDPSTPDKQYAYLFCSTGCKDMFELNPLAYEEDNV